MDRLRQERGAFYHILHGTLLRYTFRSLRGKQTHDIPQVNGQYQPVLQVQPGEAIRLRLVHGGSNDHMYISLVQSSPPQYTTTAATSAATTSTTVKAGNKGKQSTMNNGAAGTDTDTESADTGEGCTLLTLARDGVYLPAPRRQGGERGHLLMSPGSRADVALSCGRAGVYRLASSKGVGGAGGVPMSYLGKDTDVFEGELFYSYVYFLGWHRQRVGEISPHRT